jgi:hypothetical protein
MQQVRRGWIAGFDEVNFGGNPVGEEKSVKARPSLSVASCDEMQADDSFLHDEGLERDCRTRRILLPNLRGEVRPALRDIGATLDHV